MTCFCEDDTFDESWYRQCRLKRKNTYQVVWLPEAFAIVGATLRLKDRYGVWTNGWLVEAVFGRERGAELEYLEGQISLPRKRRRG